MAEGEGFDEEWENYIRGLSYSELSRELEDEEGDQKERLTVLTDVQNSIREINESIAVERLGDVGERIRRRKERIGTLRRVIGEQSAQINRVRAKIRHYDDTLFRLQETVSGHEGRLRWLPTFMILERDRTRTLINRLRRSIIAYRGHRTRQLNLLNEILRIRASDIAELGAHERWIRYEGALSERLASLRTALEYYTERARDLEAEIISEERKIEFKRQELKKLFRHHKAKLYYAKEPGKDTPEPFAEFRVWVYTRNPEDWPEHRLGELLNELEWAVSIMAGRTHIVWAKAVDVIQSFEDRPVDEDEIKDEMSRIGYSVFDLDEPYYNAVFWKVKGTKPEIEYKDSEIKGWLRSAHAKGEERGYPSADRIRQMSIEEWSSRPTPERKFKPRKRRR